MTHGGMDDYDIVRGQIRPRGDNVLVQIERPPTETASGLVLPQRSPTAIEGVWARVLAIGDAQCFAATQCPTCNRGRYPFPLDVESGDRVLLDSPHAGDVVYDVDGVERRMVRAAELVAVECRA